MLNKITTMLQMQNATNTQTIGADWTKGDHDWLLAAGMEAVEMIDGVGWKWWKHIESADLVQLQLELVDIWHFIISYEIRTWRGDIKIAAEELKALWEDHTSEEIDVKVTLKRFAADCFDDCPDLDAFINLCTHFKLSFDDLYRMYIIKNTLNKFRQDYNYKGPDYIKEWDGKEDNVHLMEQADKLDQNDPKFVDNLYAALVAVYPGKFYAKLTTEYPEQ